MKKSSIIALIVLAILAGFLFYKRGSHYRGKPSMILMSESKFDPEESQIKRGDTVTFRNVGKSPVWPASNLHPTHGIYPEFDPQHEIKPGEEWSFRFDRVGAWKYHDHLSPSTKGVIEVME